MPRDVAAISPTLAARLARTDSDRSEGTASTAFARTASLACSQQFLQGNDLSLEDARRVFEGNHTIALSLKFAAAQVVLAATLPREHDPAAVIVVPAPPRMPANMRCHAPPPPGATEEPPPPQESELVQVDEVRASVENQDDKPIVDERFGAFAIVAPAAANVPRRLSDASDPDTNLLLGDRHARRSTLSKVFEKSLSWKRAAIVNDAADKNQVESENSELHHSRRWVWCF